MPLYDFQCERGHRFERVVPVEQFDFAQRCANEGCPAPARQVWAKFPGMLTPDSASVSDDRAAYREHNITHTGVSQSGYASIGYSPNSHSMQCQCEKCCRHRKRAVVTETADHG